MKVVIFEVEDWEKEAFNDLRKEHELKFVDEQLKSTNAGQYADADVVSTFIDSQLNAEVLQQLSQLKLIATRSTGFDHIDSEYCQTQNVTICNVPNYGENTIAEHVFGLLLAISHNIIEAVHNTRQGYFSFKGLQGFDLRGKTLGVVGTGIIGQYVIQIAKGFQMEVVAFDVHPNQELAARLKFEYADLEKVLATSDIITLHVPANKNTHHLIAAEQFAKMKDGAILINTARGSVVDIQALLHALIEGKLAAAGLDVLPQELVLRKDSELLQAVDRKQDDLQTLLADLILMRLPNVIVTPHSAFNTREARERIIKTTVENILAFTQNKPQNVVNNK